MLKSLDNAKYPLLFMDAVAILFVGNTMLPDATVRPLFTTREPLSVMLLATRLVLIVVPVEALYDMPVVFAEMLDMLVCKEFS